MMYQGRRYTQRGIHPHRREEEGARGGTHEGQTGLGTMIKMQTEKNELIFEIKIIQGQENKVISFQFGLD